MGWVQLINCISVQLYGQAGLSNLAGEGNKSIQRWAGCGIHNIESNSCIDVMQRYAMQQMLKSMTQSSSPGSSNPFANMPMPPPGVGFPFPMPPPASTPMSSPTGAAATESPFDVVPTSVTPSPPTSSTSDAPTRSAEPKKSGMSSNISLIVFVSLPLADSFLLEEPIGTRFCYDDEKTMCGVGCT